MQTRDSFKKRKPFYECHFHCISLPVIDSVDTSIEIGCNKNIEGFVMAGYEIVRLLGLISLINDAKSLLERYDFASSNKENVEMRTSGMLFVEFLADRAWRDKPDRDLQGSIRMGFYSLPSRQLTKLLRHKGLLQSKEVEIIFYGFFFPFHAKNTSH